MDYISVESSNIEAVAYDEEESILGICFLNGREYQYFHVSKIEFENLLNAQSIGKYFGKHIRNNYEYRRIK